MGYTHQAPQASLALGLTPGLASLAPHPWAGLVRHRGDPFLWEVSLGTKGRVIREVGSGTGRGLEASHGLFADRLCLGGQHQLRGKDSGVRVSQPHWSPRLAPLSVTVGKSLNLVKSKFPLWASYQGFDELT